MMPLFTTTMVKKQRLLCLVIPALAVNTQGFALLKNPRRSFALRSLAEEANKEVISIDNCSLYGGDFGGLSATFSATSGKIIPVPEHLVPATLLEWRQGPICLEVIVSEDFTSDTTLTRHIVTVVPAVGCGVDNLDTIKSTEEIDTSNLVISDSFVAFDHILGSLNRAETTFSLTNDHRLRVMVDVTQDRTIKSPIVIALERKTSERSTGGTIADGGGLDGRTVMLLLGDSLKGKPFCDAEPVQWKISDDTDFTVLNLPGNVAVAYRAGSSEWILDVGHIAGGANRRVVRRRLGENGDLKGPIEYWTETKMEH
jgi:hypothetical protein